MNRGGTLGPREIGENNGARTNEGGGEEEEEGRQVRWKRCTRSCMKNTDVFYFFFFLPLLSFFFFLFFFYPTVFCKGRVGVYNSSIKAHQPWGGGLINGAKLNGAERCTYAACIVYRWPLVYKKRDGCWKLDMHNGSWLRKLIECFNSFSFYRWWVSWNPSLWGVGERVQLDY